MPKAHVLLCRIPPLYQRPDAVESPPSSRFSTRNRDGSSSASESFLQSPFKPSLRSAGPSNVSESIARLKLERSGPSGNLSKLYNMKVRAFAAPVAEGDSLDA